MLRIEEELTVGRWWLGWSGRFLGVRKSAERSPWGIGGSSPSIKPGKDSNSDTSDKRLDFFTAKLKAKKWLTNM